MRHPWLASWQGSLQVCFLYFFKKLFGFLLKAKEFDIKGKKKNLKPKMLLGSETEVFLTISTESAIYPWGSFGDAEAQISGYKITVFFFPF